jgi:hypothetical protein
VAADSVGCWVCVVADTVSGKPGGAFGEGVVGVLKMPVSVGTITSIKTATAIADVIRTRRLTDR